MFSLPLRFVLLGLLFFLRPAGKIPWAEPGEARRPGGKKLPAGAAPSGDNRDLPFAAPFSFWEAFVFFWPEAGKLRGEGAFVFFLPLGFVFLGLFFS